MTLSHHLCKGTLQADSSIRLLTGNALKFDGVDDLISSTVDIYPRDSFTIMFWARGLDPVRPGQALFQVISPENGLELQIFNSQNVELYIHGYTSGPTGIDINSGAHAPGLFIGGVGTLTFHPEFEYRPSMASSCCDLDCWGHLRSRPEHATCRYRQRVCGLQNGPG